MLPTLPLRPYTVILDSWLIFFAVWVIGAVRTKPIARRQSVARMLTQRTLGVAAWVLLFWPATRVGVLGWRFLKPDLAWDWAGAAITLAGVAIAIWARTALGGNWSANVTVKESHELVLDGPYRFVRHPIYSGITLGMIGTALAIGEVRGGVAVVLALLAWRIKWPVEERFMIDQFEDQYRDYMKRVQAVIPGLW